MKLAVILVRSMINVNEKVKTTLQMLNLNSKNGCIIIEDTPSNRGMLQIVKDYVTWGAVDEATESALRKKGDKYFRLNPPRKGYGRKGIKVPFSKGGALGDRKEKINELITRML